MTKTWLLGLTLLAVPAGAANMAGQAPAGATAAPLKAWSGPLVQTLLHVGQAGMLPHVSRSAVLAALSETVFSDTARASQQLPDVFSRLADAMHATGLTPEAWAALPPEGRLQGLANMERVAVAQAVNDADAFLARVPENMTAAQARELEAGARWLAGDAIYLPAERRERVLAVAARIGKIKRAEQKALQDWLDLTAGRMARGDFDGPGLFVRGKTGRWTAADAAPNDLGYDTLNQALDARIAEADRMPAGPWKAGMYAAMYNALTTGPEGQELALALAAEGRDVASVRQGLAVSEAGARGGSPEKAEAARAVLQRYHESGALPAGRHVVAMLKRYDEASALRLFDMPLQSRWRIAALMQQGRPAEGYPSLSDLRELGRAVRARDHRSALKGMAGFFAGMISWAVAASAFKVTPGMPLGLALIVLTFGSLAYMFVHIWRRDSTDWMFSGDEAAYGVKDVEASLAKLERAAGTKKA